MPAVSPTSSSQFTATCATAGRISRCCALGLLGQAVICQTPVGGSPARKGSSENRTREILISR
ncbi:fungal hydrophobin [Colletotrichum truncatum]|uniref:Fungal hydrophobin n=1 Tax=Colletotrichum truncatum TaxID=5467 RepID=A0ACC3YPN2_COLTU